MVIVGFLTTKGGAGKSTAVTCVAVVAFQRGLHVLVIDVDPQQTTVNWANRRQYPGPTVVAASASNLNQVLGQAREQGYDFVVVDCPGHNARALATVALAADYSILVMRPTMPDVEVAAVIRDALVEWQRSYAVLLSQAPPTFSRRLQGWCRASSALGTVVEAHLVSRVDYQDALAGGFGVTEWAPTGPAAAEAHAVFDWIWNQASGDQNDETQVA